MKLRRGVFAALVLPLVLAGPAVAADAIKVEAKLVWGTNQKSSSSKEHKPIDPKTAEELKKVFKWQNYFVINTQDVRLEKGKAETIEMSDKCSIEIKSVGGNKFEVLLVGKGERVAKGTQQMRPGEKIFLMGLDKNESSWLVVLERKKE